MAANACETLHVYLREQRQHERRQLHWFGHVQPVRSRYDIAITSTALLTALEELGFTPKLLLPTSISREYAKRT